MQKVIFTLLFLCSFLTVTQAQFGPIVTIDKRALDGTDSQTVSSGGTANFEITVTNTGSVNLIDVTVTDPLSLSCENVIGDLAIGTSITYTCSQTNVTADFINIATVTANSLSDGAANPAIDGTEVLVCMDPVLSCPNDLIIQECTSAADSAALVQAFLDAFTFTGGCNATGAFDPPFMVAPMCVGGQTVVTYVVTDDNGTYNCIRNIFVNADMTDPTFTSACPADITIECDQPLPPAPTLEATDNCQITPGPTLFINEIHYDNTGADVGEFVEVAGSAGFDLTNYSIALYNGSNGTVYSTISLSGMIDDEGTGFGAVSFLQSGIQNGAPDGLALVDPGGNVLEFLNYEGSTITATNGPANGMTSVNIGVSEPSSTPIGQSLQRTGMGGVGSDFSWTGPLAESPGTLNVGQTVSIPAPPPIPVTFEEVFVAGCGITGVYTRTWTATDACGNEAECVQTITIEDTTDPTFVGMLPADVTIECDESAPAPEMLMAMDNCPVVSSMVVFINEIHYDNTGGDVGEFFEIAGTAGLDLAGYQVALYNGSNGSVYNTINLTGVIPDEGSGFGAIDFQLPANGLQNGAPDGLALVDAGGMLIEFLSYEGTLTASGGPANGLTSTDIGVEETGAALIGESLQRTGMGGMGSDFTWTGPLAETPGVLNVGQSIMADLAPIAVTLTENFVAGGCGSTGVLTRTYTATDACGNDVEHIQNITIEDNTPPSFLGTLPMDVTVECNAIPTAPALSAVDNCGAGLMVWINEFHYDNTGGDVGEFIEVAGFAGTDLSAYALVLYNGSNGFSYNTITLSGIIPDEGTGFGAVSFPLPANGLQNGSPDGIALAQGISALQFLSYEGSFMAMNGAAAGMTSVDIGVSEPGSTPVGQSVQLTGMGSTYADFTWTGPLAESPGVLNAGQTAAGNITPDFVENTVAGGCAGESVITRTWTATDDCGNPMIHVQTITVEDNTGPDAICQNLTIELDADGNASITPDQIDNGSSDACSGVTDISLDITDFTCANLGDNTVTLSVTDGCGNTSTCTAIVTVLDNTAPVITCPDNIFIHLDPGACDAIVTWNPATATDACGDPVVTQIGGPMSGDTLERNTTSTVTYQAEDGSGNISTCSFTIQIFEFVPSSNDLTCNNLVNISLDENCSATVGADQILEGNNYGCYDDYVVTFADTGLPVVLDGSHVGNTYEVMVVGPTGNPCWGSIFVEDKLIPELICTDATIRCDEDASPEAISFPVPNTATVTPQGNNTYNVIGFDPCGAATLTYSDVEAGELCAADKTITREWVITDESGNTTFCTQTISVTPVTIADLDLPADVTIECGEDTSSANTGGLNTLCENIGTASSDETIDICEGSYKILRTWTIVDWCTNEVVEHLQVIKVLDTQGPSITCPADMTISTNSNDCFGALQLPVATATDACSSTTVAVTGASAGTLNGNILSGLPVGTHTVTYTATDGCGNESTCDMEITVEDQIAPIAICDEHTVVGIGSDGTAAVEAITFDDGSFDNCEIVTMDARRMDNPNCPGFDATPFGPTVPFYCCDVNTTVMVEFRVIDAAGSVNSCMVEVDVEDKINPTIVCAPNADVECSETYLDYIEVGQPLPQDAIDANGEAAAADNCDGVTLTNNVIGNTVDCGEGTITIVWTATDAGGRTASCIQRYFVENNDPFEEADITWPLDYTANTCGVGLEPDDLSSPYNYPTVDEGACNNVAIGHQDQVLDFGAQDACLKILRKWYVIDWCQADNPGQDPTVPGPGVWHYTQVIKVINSTPPMISCEPDNGIDTYPNFDENCGPLFVDLKAVAQDDCTPADLLQFTWALSDGQTGTGNDASQSLENGDYSITFTVTDLCGNTSECTRSFTIFDAKQPTPVCIFGIATTVMPSSGAVTIWATDFESGSSFDNCTAYDDLQFSFAPDVTIDNITITCNDIPADGLVPVSIYVTDEAGNQDFCTTFIQVQDPNGVCSIPAGLISGTIENEIQDQVEEVTVTLTDSNTPLPISMVTGSDGQFSFNGNGAIVDYNVSPEKDINYLNGVTTFDLVLISKHILGTELLDSPYKIIAADANNSQTVSTLDIVKLRALILHIDDELEANNSWRFVDASFVFPNPLNPWETTFPEDINLGQANGPNFDPANFMAVKIGDVNASASPNSLLDSDTRTFNGTLAFQVDAEKVAVGETFTMDFRASDFTNISGYQFSLGFEVEAVEFVDVTTNLKDLEVKNFGLTKLAEGIITTSWNSSKELNVEDNDVLFSMTFVAKKNSITSDIFKINSRYTTSEAYAGNDILDVNLDFNLGGSSTEFELYQNQPNPFKAETMISFNLPEAGDATLKIFDVSGRILKLIELEAVKGFNAVNISREGIQTTGVLYYQLETASETATKKMILVD